MYQIDNEKFGTFLVTLRKEKQMTQKELAEQLFVSDKTVSKWERGASLPNVALLIPIADVFGISVTELLKGERTFLPSALHKEENDTLTFSVKNAIQHQKRLWKLAFGICVFLVSTQFSILLLSDISFQQAADVLSVSVFMLFFAGWLCFFAKEILPPYYAENKINFVSQGIFRIHMTGLSFHNGNWYYICNVFRLFTLAIALLYPFLCVTLLLTGQYHLWNNIKGIFILIALFLMLAVAYIVGKKYE